MTNDLKASLGDAEAEKKRQRTLDFQQSLHALNLAMLASRERLTPEQKSRPALVLLDASNIIYRFWFSGYSTPGKDAEGVEQKALYSLMRSLGRLYQTVPFKFIPVVIFETQSPGLYRRTIDPDYSKKRTRDPKITEAVLVQSRIAMEALRAIGIPFLDIAGHEADDVIASVVASFREDHQIIIDTGDKDAFGLVATSPTERTEAARHEPGVHVLRKSLQTHHFELWGAESVEAHYGITPHLWTDMLALTGDVGDNIITLPPVPPRVYPFDLKVEAAAAIMQHGSLAAYKKHLEALLAAPAAPEVLEALRPQIESLGSPTDSTHGTMGHPCDDDAMTALRAHELLLGRWMLMSRQQAVLSRFLKLRGASVATGSTDPEPESQLSTWCDDLDSEVQALPVQLQQIEPVAVDDEATATLGIGTDDETATSRVDGHLSAMKRFLGTLQKMSPEALAAKGAALAQDRARWSSVLTFERVASTCLPRFDRSLALVTMKNDIPVAQELGNQLQHALDTHASRQGSNEWGLLLRSLSDKHGFSSSERDLEKFLRPFMVRPAPWNVLMETGRFAFMRIPTPNAMRVFDGRRSTSPYSTYSTRRALDAKAVSAEHTTKGPSPT